MNLKKSIRGLLRYRLNRKNRKLLKNRDFTVFCNNCVGGVMLHELGQRFNTPTINLWFRGEDYVKFLKNPRYYIQCSLQEVRTDKTYPVGLLGDILIYFQHYTSFEEAKSKWYERCKRINFDNLYVIMVERACVLVGGIVKEFDSLPYEHKVIFTVEDLPNIKSAVHIENSVDNKGEVMDLCLYKSKFSGRRWLDDFDYVKFFNEK